MRRVLCFLLIIFITNSNASYLGMISVKAETQIEISNVSQTPWIIEDKGILKSEVILTIENSSKPYHAWVRISVENKPAYMESLGILNTGTNTATVYIPELDKDNDRVTFEIFNDANGKGAVYAYHKQELKKIRHWKIYSAHDMHLDIGFTDHPEKLNSVTWPGHIDTAVKYIKESNGWNKNDQFRYPLEESYLLFDTIWNSKNADQIDEIKKLLKEGRMSYPSSYLNEAYEAMGTEELARFHYFSERYLKDKMGVGSNKVIVKSDDPGLSWANIDAMVESGVKYCVFRPNLDTNNWDSRIYPALFYIEGRIPENRLLFYNGIVYSADKLGLRKKSKEVFSDVSKKIFDQKFINDISSVIMSHHINKYPYDAILLDYTDGGDNGGITPEVMNNIKDLNSRKDQAGRRYVYPQFINSTANDFFEYVESTSKASIPVYKGTLENYWNFGAASTSYETGLNKVNHEKLPAAEFFSTIANLKVPNSRYLYENIMKAYNDMVLYDEHSWGAGPGGCEVNDLWRWKRNTAIASATTADRVLSDSLSAISKLIPTKGKAVVVYNNLSWNRSDVVKVDASELPEYFDIVDKDTEKSIKYQKLNDGKIAFVAENVPGLGYKSFDIVPRKEQPDFSTTIAVTEDTIENRFFKVTFDKTGSIKSIFDKRNNSELIDNEAPYAANQFIFYNSAKQKNKVLESSSVSTSVLSGNTGEVMGMFTSNGCTGVEKGIDSMKRNVILYDSIPRIDIVNEVLKSEALDYDSQDEEGFFAFPFKMPNFMIRHEMPTGDVRPYVDKNIDNQENEQLYSSSTDHYTVNRWIDLSNQKDFGITFSPVNAPIVQYGERRSYKFAKNYNTSEPWIYSYVFSNKWWTNFQKTQPGPITFKYSIMSHKGGNWKEGRSDKFGMEAANEMTTVVIQDSQKGKLDAEKGQFISIDKDNVVLTTAKLSEMNGEGIILRFNESLGMDTDVTVDLSFLNPTSVVETDLVENDRKPLSISNKQVSFRIRGHGWKTLRVKSESKTYGVSDAKATMDSQGTYLVWDHVNKENFSYYEIFRSDNKSFTPGEGNYIASVSDNHYFDTQVKTGISKKYYYKVRAVYRGNKGPSTSAITATQGTIADNEAPAVPKNLKLDFGYKTRISFSWEPSEDNVRVAGYKIYKNGKEYKNVSATLNSDLDISVSSSENYYYCVRAYDWAGNLSEPSNMIKFVSSKMSLTQFNIAPLARISASSYLGQGDGNDSYKPEKVVDGIIGQNDKGEWASSWGKAWIKFEWDCSKTINKIILYDRPNLMDNITDGRLTFSDGSSIDIKDIPVDGTAKEIKFPEKDVTWVMFDVLENAAGTTKNAGLSEIQIFEENLAYIAQVKASSELDANNGAMNVNDGLSNIEGPVEWISKGEKNPWVRLEWNQPVKINAIALNDRMDPNSNIIAGTIRLSDGSSIKIKDIPADGTSKEIVFSTKEVTWIEFKATKMKGKNVGLAEIKVFSLAAPPKNAEEAEMITGGEKDAKVAWIVGTMVFIAAMAFVLAIGFRRYTKSRRHQG